MPFLSRLALAEPFETWPGMEAAAEARYWDGFALATGEPGHETGSVYLFGYAAEILLKTAYFRFVGLSASQNSAPQLRFVRTHNLWSGRNLHDLRGWADFLLDTRRLQGHPLAAPFAGVFRQQMIVLDLHWRESLRYTGQVALESEQQEVLESVEWIRDYHSLLWR